MKYLMIFTSLLLATNTASADLDQAMDDMCKKMKACSTAEIKRQGLSEDMQLMMTAMFDGMCKTWMTPYANALGNAGLESKAQACIDSVVAVSCEALMQSEGNFTSEECEAFEKAIDKSGVDLENVAN